LLSGTSKKERAANASGGLLREIGEHGTLVLKDFTSILSMNRDTRAALLAALREIFDGRWSRHVGTDGGQTLNWHGKLAVIACCTTAIDRAHAVTATMGERFLLCRLPPDDNDDIAARALAQAGHEHEMRHALIEGVRGLFTDGLPHEPKARTRGELKRLVRLARLVALSRSPVERDHQGELDLVLDAEAPTRLAKQPSGSGPASTRSDTPTAGMSSCASASTPSRNYGAPSCSNSLPTNGARPPRSRPRCDTRPVPAAGRLKNSPRTTSANARPAAKDTPTSGVSPNGLPKRSTCSPCQKCQ
jgi:hypothetical protein